MPATLFPKSVFGCTLPPPLSAAIFFLIDGGLAFSPKQNPVMDAAVWLLHVAPELYRSLWSAF